MSVPAGTGKLVRLILRRDRWLLPLWLLLALFPVSAVNSLGDLYPTAAERQDFAAEMEGNSALMVLYGRLYGSDLGELAVWRAGFMPVFFGLLALLFVIRHTRTEEESGRRELVGAASVDRRAPLAAALAVAFLVALVAMVLVGTTVQGQGLPAAGSWAFGAQYLVVGAVFAAVGGVAAQLTTSALTARGIAVAVLGVFFALRGVGDSSGQRGGAASWVSWTSPFGWANQLRPFDGDRWWVLAVPLAAVVVLVAAAHVLSARRDLGAGLLPDRLGPPEAAPSLRSPLALAWRIQRGAQISWLAGFAVAGLVYGGLAKTVAEGLEDNPNKKLEDALARLGGQGGLIDTWLASMLNFMAIAAAAYAIQAVLRLRAEETSLRAESLLATGVARLRWAAGHLVFAVAGPVVVLLVAGLGAGLASGDPGRQIPRLLGASAAQLPAVWVLVAVGLLVFGRLPRLSPIAWGALGVCVMLGQVGALLELSQWVLDVSPFTHTPKLPGGDPSVTPLVSLTAVALAVGAAGLAALRRRDLPA
ncbi:ABC transporter permease [Actinomadura graeca]|uniref:ABC transporter permease n=1 Tax=Actinomadura graeca TaxID=2750812 RepID=A0ABX8R7B2_9ACTN|nr:ABC transporter permease [Actinomadura graeca]QXJ26154.1 ABC transporter permease [Actinomadura graeca]